MPLTPSTEEATVVTVTTRELALCAAVAGIVLAAAYALSKWRKGGGVGK